MITHIKSVILTVNMRKMPVLCLKLFFPFTLCCLAYRTSYEHQLWNIKYFHKHKLLLVKNKFPRRSERWQHILKCEVLNTDNIWGRKWYIKGKIKEGGGQRIRERKSERDTKRTQERQMRSKDKHVNDLLTKLSSFPAVLAWVKSLFIKEERWSRWMRWNYWKVLAFHYPVFEILDQA